MDRTTGPARRPDAPAPTERLLAAVVYLCAPLGGLVILGSALRARPFLLDHARQSIVFGGALIAAILAVVAIDRAALSCLALPLLLALPFLCALPALRGRARLPILADLAPRVFRAAPRAGRR